LASGVVLFEELDADATPDGVSGALVFACGRPRDPLKGSREPKCANLALAPLGAGGVLAGAVGGFAGTTGDLLPERDLRFLCVLPFAIL